MFIKAGLVAVNAESFRRIRKQLGWSQAELGRRSGYSERVIRKAESGGILRQRTLAELASAMKTKSEAISR